METHTMTTGAKQRTKCVNCLKRLNEDDAVWANKDGQIVDGVSDYAWCVECLPEEKNAMTTGDKGAKQRHTKPWMKDENGFVVDANGIDVAWYEHINVGGADMLALINKAEGRA